MRSGRSSLIPAESIPREEASGQSLARMEPPEPAH